MIFNVVMDAFLQHWFYVVAETELEEGLEVFGRGIQQMAANFYANYGILASTRAARIQQELRVLKEFFKWVVLQTKVGKTVNMACQPCHTIWSHSMEAYVKGYWRISFSPNTTHMVQ